MLPTRDFTAVARWLRAQPHHVRERLDYGCLDMSKTYAAVFRVVTPKATRVVDRFHVMRHAILAVDQVRRRVQQQRTGHRGRAGDPLYRARKLLVINATATDPELQERLEGLLGTRRPRRRGGLRLLDERGRGPLLRDRATPRPRPICCATSSTWVRSARLPSRSGAWLAPCPTGSTPSSPGTAPGSPTVPTEGMNNLLKRVKRVAFGFTNFENFRIRALLYAGKPNVRVLDSIVVT